MIEEISLFLSKIEFHWDWIESIAVCFSIAYVILAAKGNIWCWLFGSISVSIYIYICIKAQLFAESSLQVFYLLMAIYGYYNWNQSKDKFSLKQWSAGKHLLLILSGAVFAFLIGFYFVTYTEAKMPIVDSFTTAFSIIATYLVVKKILENWLYWIIINAVSVYIYFNINLHLSALLFLTYSLIAIFGYFNWKKKLINA